MNSKLKLDISLSGFDLDKTRAFFEKGSNFLRELFDDRLTEGRWTGWIKHPHLFLNSQEYQDIKEESKKLRDRGVEFLVVIAIGGSYTGTRALLDILKTTNTQVKGCKILFAGKSLSTLELNSIINKLRGRSFAINVVSKSGKTIEIISIFETFRQLLIASVGEERSRELIFVTTDKNDGLLREITNRKGYKSFEIPTNIGGRFSSLTAVGILPLEFAGFNTSGILEGASRAYQTFYNQNKPENPALIYATLRFLLAKEYIGEFLVVYEPILNFFCEWWKQIFAESEGKKREGILLPMSVIFSTDLHSMGQYIQDGPKLAFQTTLWIEDCGQNYSLPEFKDELIQYSCLNSKSLNFLNKAVFKASLKAHNSFAKISQIVIKLADLSAEALGELIAFFQISCVISALLFDVNPFDQPGVEIYKKEMLKLLN